MLTPRVPAWGTPGPEELFVGTAVPAAGGTVPVGWFVATVGPGAGDVAVVGLTVGASFLDRQLVHWPSERTVGAGVCGLLAGCAVPLGFNKGPDEGLTTGAGRGEAGVPVVFTGKAGELGGGLTTVGEAGA